MSVTNLHAYQNTGGRNRHSSLHMQLKPKRQGALSSEPILCRIGAKVFSDQRARTFVTA